jgi:hypothetical protein
MNRLPLAVLLALAFAGASAAGTTGTGVAAGQYYKWKDQNGAWNYSSTPPKDQTATTVNIATGAAGPAAATAPEQANGSDATAPKPEPNVVANEAAMAAVARQKQTQNANCDRARNNVATLESDTRVQMDRADGYGEKPLNDDEHMAELQKARKQVEVFCNPQ